MYNAICFEDQGVDRNTATRLMNGLFFPKHQASQVALVGNNLSANLRGKGSVSRSRRSPGGGHGDPLYCSCLEKPMDRGAWQATVHGVEKVGHNFETKQQKQLAKTEETGDR